MDIENILIFCNRLRESSGAVWVEDGMIKLSVPKIFQNEETKEFIKVNRSVIVTLLQRNRIFSKLDFSENIILSSGEGSIYPLSYGQERLWFIETLSSGTSAYTIPFIRKLFPETNVEAIKLALQQIVRRHEILRSTILKQANEATAVQIVHEDPLPIHEVIVPEGETIARYLNSDVRRSFDLSTEYPIRATIYRPPAGSDGDPVLLINRHHIASDAWSSEIFRRELSFFYDYFSGSNPDEFLPELSIQYKDYARWQRIYLTGEEMQRQLAYWKDRMQGYQQLDLPTDYSRPAIPEYGGARETVLLSGSLSHAIKNAARDWGVTLNTVILSSVSVFLSKVTGQGDIVTGSPIANRHHRQTEGLIGFFVNTQVNRIELTASDTFESVVRRVHQSQTESQLHQDLPFDKLVEALNVERDIARHPIFQVMVNLQVRSGRYTGKNSALDADDDVDDLVKFDLSISARESSDGIVIDFMYRSALFKKDTVARWVNQYVYLQEQLIQLSPAPLSELGLAPAQELNEILCNWNATQKDYPDNKTISQLFTEQAIRTPDAHAVLYGDIRLSYSTLEAKSNQLARFIRKCYHDRTGTDLTADTFIPLFLERGPEMILAMLGILKAGGAYVPLDVSSPRERITYVLEDTKAFLVLTDSRLSERIDGAGLADKAVFIAWNEQVYAHESTAPVEVWSRTSDLAYVLYTSGTTGYPKGVMIEHRSVLSLVFNDYIDTGLADTFAFLSSPAFDAATFEIWTPLLRGGTLAIPLDGFDALSNTDRLKEFLGNDGITVLWLTKTLFDSLYTANRTIFKNLNYLIVGGEALDKNSVSQLAASSDRPRYLLNGYGPTESTTFTTVYSIQDALESNTVPIGSPINNRTTYVLDANRQPLPVGVRGELYIGGHGIARGYLNQPELTEACFVSNPFADIHARRKGFGRLYKTGDAVRWLPDGNIEYLGRLDTQVKIRGYRIELTEIENVLTRYSGIRQACVIVRERSVGIGSTKYLVGYYVVDHGIAVITPDKVAEYLRLHLPLYMVPEVLMELLQIPLTVNGKLDKNALPFNESFTLSYDEAAPNSPDAEEMCQIWKDVLGVHHVGLHDDFFRLGGNSILAIHASHKMSTALALDVKVSDIFRFKTIANLLIETRGRVGQSVIPSIDAREAVLSFAQERLWFIEQYDGGTNAYHIPLIKSLDAGVDPEGVQYALRQIVARHEVLRSLISPGDGLEGPRQVIHTDPLPIEIVHCRDEYEYEKRITYDISRIFDLQTEYPIRVRFYKIAQEGGIQKIYLLINIHHIASDGWSTKIFWEEFALYYGAYQRQEKDFSLPPLAIQYKDYAIWQRKILTGATLQTQINYWRQKLSGFQSLQLPLDFIRPLQMDYHGDRERFVFDEELSKMLRALAQRHGATLHSVLLSGFYVLLSHYSGQDDIVIGTLMANRQYRQTEKLIGFFVNTQVSRMQLLAGESFDELITRVHRDQVEAQLYQDLPFEKLVNELDVERDASRHPIFQVIFGVQSFGTSRNTTFVRSEDDSGKDGRVAKFDLSMLIDDQGETLSAFISYATRLFRSSSIRRMVEHYMHLLLRLVADPARPYLQAGFLTVEEKNMLLTWCSTGILPPPSNTLHAAFAQRCKRTPDNPALICDGIPLTYRELDEKSNQLARRIQESWYLLKGEFVEPDTCIGFCLDRGPEMIISMLAILKAGAAYVPIDLGYPADRVAYLLADANVEILLTQRSVSMQPGGVPIEKIVYVDFSETFYETESKLPLPVKATSENLAYVIYTSGTSGNPKGVMIEHRAVLSLVFNDFISIAPSDVFSFISSSSFDAATFEIWTPLLHGNPLVIAKDLNQILSDTEAMKRFIREYKISVMWLTKTLFDTLYYADDLLFRDLNYLIIGGEALERTLVASMRLNPARPQHFLNGYGPTESTTFACMYDLYNEVTSPNVPIGKPIKNRTVYVLNADLEPVAIGVIGELYLGGPGLARGYRNKEELTEARFIRNPFAGSTHADNVLYRTGDLVRWLPDGNLEFLGRNDDQVKLRGYRIQLGEIEHALLQVPGVQQARVLVIKKTVDTGVVSHLVAYYISDAEEITPSGVLNALMLRLPMYMVPSVVMPVQAFPLTHQGKLDRDRLPEPDFMDTSSQYVAPSTEIEKLLCRIWGEVLGMDSVGITDDFFRIGGNSILAIRASQRMSKAVGYRIMVADIFRLKTVQKLSSLSRSQSLELARLYHANYNSRLTDMVFIPPARAGAEMYQTLADKLQTYYNCVGLENYNIHSNDKIDSLRGLAERYLAEYEQKFTLTNGVHLLGWSLGGQIALEIASILEARGYYNISVTLLDTHILAGVEQPSMTLAETNVANSELSCHDEGYAQQVLAAWQIERRIARTPVSTKLTDTKVTLFRATQIRKKRTEDGADREGGIEMNSNNNVDSVTNRLNVLELDCNHYSLFNHLDIICRTLITPVEDLQ